MTTAFAQSIRRIAQRARAGALGADGEWFAAGLETHLVKPDCPLDHAMSLAWGNACRRRRDQGLREYAGRHCRDPILSRQAARLAIEVERYERGNWRHDRLRTEMPKSYIGTPHELLFLAFTENEAITPHRAMPSSVKQLMKIILGDNGNDPPIPTSENRVSNTPNEGDRDEGESAPAPAQRRWKVCRA
jgi:hypothetical protein